MYNKIYTRCPLRYKLLLFDYSVVIYKQRMYNACEQVFSHYVSQEYDYGLQPKLWKRGSQICLKIMSSTEEKDCV